MIRKCHQRGDTLVEVAIAIAIISSVIVSLSVLANASFRLGETARQRTEAASLLQQEAELIRNQRDGDIVNSGPTGGAAGWNPTFLTEVFGGSTIGPPCVVGSGSGVSYTQSPPAPFSFGGGAGNKWTGTLISYTVTTSQGIYTVTTNACILGTTSVGVTDDIRFMIHIQWTGADNTQQQGDLDTELVDVSNINQLAPTL